MNIRYENLIVAFAILFLSSCGSQSEWRKTDTADQQLARDKYECMQETGYTEMNAFTKLGLVLSSTSAGAQNAPNPYAARAQANSQSRKLFELCMKSRGYRN